jgi:tetratricopeptide (TPR) repeat protein
MPLPVADAGDGRLSSLGACITYSYAHLSDQTRMLLPVVSLFHGIADELILTLFSDVESAPGFLTGASAALGRFAGVTGQQWTTALQEAARVGLLSDPGGGIYQIHPALPGYLAAAWHAEDPAGYSQERTVCEQALCTACAAFSALQFQEIQSGNAAIAHVMIRLHQQTLVAALGYALNHHAWMDAEFIVMALDEHWDARGLVGESGAWADRILNAITGPGQTVPEPARELWQHVTIGHGARQLRAGDPDGAEHTYRSVLAYLRDQPETELVRTNISVIYHQLGIAALDSGRLDEAEDWYKRAMQIREELGLRALLATDYHQLGIIAQRSEQLDEAEDWHRKSLAILEELEDRPRTAVSYLELGTTAFFGGRQDEAENWYRRALTIFQELGDLPYMAVAFHQLGMVAEDGGRLDEAEDWSRRALTIEEGIGDRPHMAFTYHQLGDIALGRRRLDDAESWYRGALRIFEELGDRPHMAATSAQLGLLAERRDQARQALEWNIRCVTLFDQFPSPLTATGPASLTRLTHKIGFPALETAWQQITGEPLPQAVRDYITSHFDNDQPEARHDRPSRRRGPFRRRHPRP